MNTTTRRGAAALCIAVLLVWLFPAGPAGAATTQTAATAERFLELVNDTTTSVIVLTADIPAPGSGEWGNALLAKTISGNGNALALPGVVSLSGALQFTELVLDFSANTLFAANWNALAFGPGLTTSYAPGRAPSYLLGGRMLQSASEVVPASAGISIASGDFPFPVAAGSLSGGGETTGTIRLALTGGSADTITSNITAPHNGDVEITLTGGSVGSLYGAGLAGIESGGVTGNIYLTLDGSAQACRHRGAIYGGVVGGSLFGQSHITITGSAKVGSAGAKANIYGGGAQSSTGAATSSEQSNITIAASAVVYADVFGGGNANSAVGSANLALRGGSLNGRLFGGGAGADVGASNITITAGTHAAAVFGGGYNSSVTQAANITMAGGNVSQLVGSGYAYLPPARAAYYTNKTNITISGGAVGPAASAVVAGSLNDSCPVNVSATITISSGTLLGDIVAEVSGTNAQGEKTVITLEGIDSTNAFAGYTGAIRRGGGNNDVRLIAKNSNFTFLGSIELSAQVGDVVESAESSSVTLGAKPGYTASIFSAESGSTLAFSADTTLNCMLLYPRGGTIALGGAAVFDSGDFVPINNSRLALYVSDSAAGSLSVTGAAFGVTATVEPHIAADWSGARVYFAEADAASSTDLFALAETAGRAGGFEGEVRLGVEVSGNRVRWYLEGTSAAKPAEPQTPPTGDYANLVARGVALAAAFVAVACLAKIKRRLARNQAAAPSEKPQSPEEGL